jgi:hypothetical protein
MTNQNDRREDENNRVQRVSINHISKQDIHHFQKTARHDSLAQSYPSHRKEHNRPHELFKIILQTTISKHQYPPKKETLTFFNTPVPKNATIGTIATTPISPTHSSIPLSTHHNPIVTTHTPVTHHCLPVNPSFVGLIALISKYPSPSGALSGRYDRRSSTHMRRRERKDTGRLTANQDAQSKRGFMASRAMRFWGEEMGELCPPMLAASAIASWLFIYFFSFFFCRR